MALSRLYNLDESRTTVYEQTFQVPGDTRKVYLDHLPKAGTLVIQKLVPEGEPITYVIISDGEPKAGEVYFEYRDEYDYIAAKGVLIFSSADAGSEYSFYARYIPVASRVDANVINNLIDSYNIYNGNVWLKSDLSTPTSTDIIAWTAIKGRPELATTTSNGLMSKEDKVKLNASPDFTTNIHMLGGLTFGIENSTNTTEYYPSTLGGNITVVLDDTLSVTKYDTNKLLLEVNDTGIRSMLGISIATSAALVGTTGTPSETNKFVTNEDPRMTDSRTPLSHTHGVADIDGLSQTLETKASKIHEHTLSDINGWTDALKGEDGTTPTIEFLTPETGDPGTSVLLENITGDLLNQKILLTIPRGQDGTVAWEDLTEPQKEQIKLKGDKGDRGIPAALLLAEGGVHTGDPYSSVEIVSTGPEETEIGGTVYSATTWDITIPRGVQGETGYSGAAIVGTVETTANNTDAEITYTGPVEKVLPDGKTYGVTTLNFKLPRGPKGSSRTDPLLFATEATEGYYSDWVGPDEYENYTLTIPVIGVIPSTLPFEEVSTGLYQSVLATVRFDYDHVYIIADHKFNGRIYVEGLATGV